MHKYCNLLSATFDNFEEISVSTINNFFYKLQKIVSYEREVIGYEVLLDFVKAKRLHPDSIEMYTQAISDGSSLNFLLSSLLATKTSQLPAGSKLFINVERVNLCNKFILRKIVAASRMLRTMFEVDLVVEITERNSCGYCNSILQGMLFLKKNKIFLAVDDFDIYGDDFRKKEIDTGIYSYIKVVMPRSPAEAAVFNSFILTRSESVILEMVEDHDMISAFELKKIYGYQGFAYN